MPITPAAPYPKSPGDDIRSTDWNQTVDEVIRLDNAKVDNTGDTIDGQLTINDIGADNSNKIPLRVSAQGGGGKWGGIFTSLGDDGVKNGVVIVASGVSSTKTALYADASGNNDTKIGVTARATGDNGVKIGMSSFVNGTDGEKTGLQVTASGNAGVKNGAILSVSGTDGIKTGLRVTTSGQTDLKSGIESFVSGENNTKTGLTVQAEGINGIKYGVIARASGNENLKLGISSNVSGVNGTKTGIESRASGANGTKYGVLSNVSGADGNKYGLYSAVSGADGNKYGVFSNITGNSTSGTKFGLYTTVSGDDSGSKYGVFSITNGNAAAGTFKVGVYGSALNEGQANYGIFGIASGATTNYAGYFSGDVRITGNLQKGSGTFLIDHPLDPLNKVLRHYFVESPESLCLYRGTAKLNTKGTTRVSMPAYFAGLTKENEATVLLTSIGPEPFTASYEWDEDFMKLTLYGAPKREVSYLVLADRDDPVAHKHKRPVEEKKTTSGEFEKGRLLYPDAYKEHPDIVGASKKVRDKALTPTTPELDTLPGQEVESIGDEMTTLLSAKGDPGLSGATDVEAMGIPQQPEANIKDIQKGVTKRIKEVEGVMDDTLKKIEEFASKASKKGKKK